MAVSKSGQNVGLSAPFLLRMLLTNRTLLLIYDTGLHFYFACHIYTKSLFCVQFICKFLPFISINRKCVYITHRTSSTLIILRHHPDSDFTEFSPQTPSNNKQQLLFAYKLHANRDPPNGTLI